VLALVLALALALALVLALALPLLLYFLIEGIFLASTFYFLFQLHEAFLLSNLLVQTLPWLDSIVSRGP
jgi:hypothetical protein